MTDKPTHAEQLQVAIERLEIIKQIYSDFGGKIPQHKAQKVWVETVRATSIIKDVMVDLILEPAAPTMPFAGALDFSKVDISQFKALNQPIAAKDHAIALTDAIATDLNAFRKYYGFYPELDSMIDGLQKIKSLILEPASGPQQNEQ